MHALRPHTVMFEVKNLGVGYSLNHKKSKGKFVRLRFKKSQARASKSQKLFKAKDHKKIHLQAVCPAALYGAELSPYPPAMAHKLRIQTIKASGLYNPGGNVDLMLCCLPLTDDPLWKIVWEPIQAISAEWWTVSSLPKWDQQRPSDLLTIKELTSLLCEELLMLDRNDPLGALAGSLDHLGWKLVNPTKLMDTQNEILNMLDGPTAMLKSIAKRIFVAKVSKDTRKNKPRSRHIMGWQGTYPSTTDQRQTQAHTKAKEVAMCKH